MRERVELGDKFYYVNYHGGINCDIENGMKLDDKLFALGNYFKTRSEARKSEFFKVRAAQIGRTIERLPKGTNFYFICIDGDVHRWEDTYTTFEQRMINAGNYYHTEEEAKESVVYKLFCARIKTAGTL